MYYFAVTEAQDFQSESWYALYTKPHAERQVAERLSMEGLETYLPMMPVWRARRHQVELEPLFPCYSFARVNLKSTSISKLNWTPGLRHVVSCDGIPTPVPASVVKFIRERAEALQAEGPTQFRQGDHLRINQGPLSNLEVVFQRSLSGAQRAEVFVQVLGHLTRADVPIQWLEKL